MDQTRNRFSFGLSLLRRSVFPSVFSFFFYIHIFFCLVSGDLLSPQGAENLLKGQRSLTNAYLSYLDQICHQNEQMKFSKAALMKSLIDDITSETKWRIAFSQRTFLPTLHKVIDSRGRMVSTIFNGNAKQYNKENGNVEELEE